MIKQRDFRIMCLPFYWCPELQLLEYGAPVDAVDGSKGRTALHRAIKGSVMMYPLDEKIIALLLESGANPFCGDNKGDCMHWAVH